MRTGIDKKTLGILSSKVRVDKRRAHKAQANGYQVWRLVHTPPHGQEYEKYFMRPNALKRFLDRRP